MTFTGQQTIETLLVSRETNLEQNEFYRIFSSSRNCHSDNFENLKKNLNFHRVSAVIWKPPLANSYPKTQCIGFHPTDRTSVSTQYNIVLIQFKTHQLFYGPRSTQVLHLDVNFIPRLHAFTCTNIL